MDVVVEVVEVVFLVVEVVVEVVVFEATLVVVVVFFAVLVEVSFSVGSLSGSGNGIIAEKMLSIMIG